MKDVGQTAGPNISGDAEEFCFMREAHEGFVSGHFLLLLQYLLENWLLLTLTASISTPLGLCVVLFALQNGFSLLVVTV